MVPVGVLSDEQSLPFVPSDCSPDTFARNARFEWYLFAAFQSTPSPRRTLIPGTIQSNRRRSQELPARVDSLYCPQPSSSRILQEAERLAVEQSLGDDRAGACTECTRRPVRSE